MWGSGTMLTVGSLSWLLSFYHICQSHQIFLEQHLPVAEIDFLFLVGQSYSSQQLFDVGSKEGQFLWPSFTFPLSVLYTLMRNVVCLYAGECRGKPQFHPNWSFIMFSRDVSICWDRTINLQHNIGNAQVKGKLYICKFFFLHWKCDITLL